MISQNQKTWRGYIYEPWVWLLLILCVLLFVLLLWYHYTNDYISAEQTKKLREWVIADGNPEVIELFNENLSGGQLSTDGAEKVLETMKKEKSELGLLLY